MNSYEWVFIPVIKGVTYKFKVNDSNIERLEVNGNELIPAFPLPTDFYFNINSRRITMFRNVFTLFNTIAFVRNYKIRIQVTFDPSDYIRGFIFPVLNHEQLDNIFKGTKTYVNRKTFLVHNQNEVIGNIKNIMMYLNCGITMTDDIIEEYADESTITVTYKNTMTIENQGSVTSIFKYCTVRNTHNYDNIIFLNNMVTDRIKHETIKKWLESGWNFYNKKIKVEPLVFREIMNMSEGNKSEDLYDIRLLRDFGFIIDDDHEYYVIRTSIMNIDELKKRIMQWLDASIINMKIQAYNQDSEGMIENYEKRIVDYINKIEKDYETQKVYLVKIIHADKSNNVVELIDSILPEGGSVC